MSTNIEAPGTIRFLIGAVIMLVGEFFGSQNSTLTCELPKFQELRMISSVAPYRCHCAALARFYETAQTEEETQRRRYDHRRA